VTDIGYRKIESRVERGLRHAANAVWLTLLVLLAILDGIALVSSITEYGHENRAPGVTLAFVVLSLIAVLAAIASRHRGAQAKLRERASMTSTALSVSAVVLFLFAVLVAFAAGPH
jgi:drug/metabolite transporter (DMT)-like permease